MRFDDRLATVLDQPAGDAHGRAVQWRQLVELIARGDEGSPELRDQALSRVATLMDAIAPPVLAATARAIAGRQVPAELVALFAARGAAASAALVMAAELDEGGWAAVRAVAAADVEPLLASLAPPSPPPAKPRAETAPSPSPPPLLPSRPEPKADPLPLPAGLFRWECGPTGDIDWVEGAPRAALVGRSLTEPFADRFAARLPFSDEPLVLAEEGALGGEWRWSGSPAFFPDTGRFAGYRGIARREGVEPASGALAQRLPHDDDLRELMHELRTPLNAIIGFGEIIEGQYLGPAHRSYRTRASEIVRQARRLADAVDNLDLGARLRSGRYDGEASSSIAALRDVLVAVAGEARTADVILAIDDRAGPVRIALPLLLIERLLRQFVSALAEAAGPGEALGVVLDVIGPMLAIAVDRPRALRDLSEEQLLEGEEALGTRFDLRMVHGLVAMVGGRVDIAADRLILLLPLVDDDD